MSIGNAREWRQVPKIFQYSPFFIASLVTFNKSFNLHAEQSIKFTLRFELSLVSYFCLISHVNGSCSLPSLGHHCLGIMAGLWVYDVQSFGHLVKGKKPHSYFKTILAWVWGFPAFSLLLFLKQKKNDFRLRFRLQKSGHSVTTCTGNAQKQVFWSF